MGLERENEERWVKGGKLKWAGEEARKEVGEEEKMRGGARRPKKKPRRRKEEEGGGRGVRREDAVEARSDQRAKSGREAREA